VTVGTISERIAGPLRMVDPCEFAQTIPRPLLTSESAS
jgi:hypothetical protein